MTELDLESPPIGSGTVDLPPTVVLENTRVLDVTDRRMLLERSRITVARAYAEFAAPPLDPTEVYRDLCTDEFEREGRARTFAAFTLDPASGQSELSGTIRLTTGIDRPGWTAPPIHAMSLLTAPAWPHRTVQGGNPVGIGELTRFIVPERYRVKSMVVAGVPFRIATLLIREAVRVAAGMSVGYVYAMMPRHVHLAVRMCGVRWTRVQGVQLNWDDEAAAAFLRRYGNYFCGFRPNLYLLDLSQPAMALQ